MPERRYKLLIVDDSKAILAGLSRAFRKTPYEVVTVDNPMEAYDLIQDRHFDIVISDIEMPEMNGLELLRKIKNYNGMIQVIIFTGYITINNTLNAFRYGAFDLFFKPVADDVLVAAVDQAAARLNRINNLIEEVANARQGGVR